jgi:hypothetical protein
VVIVINELEDTMRKKGNEERGASSWQEERISGSRPEERGNTPMLAGASASGGTSEFRHGKHFPKIMLLVVKFLFHYYLWFSISPNFLFLDNRQLFLNIFVFESTACGVHNDSKS